MLKHPDEVHVHVVGAVDADVWAVPMLSVSVEEVPVTDVQAAEKLPSELFAVRLS
jgi:hypothetical protein